ncbi:MAG: cyclase family protein, partial [Planctomycetes bacterium]|nr:cyclase family protein [Planctomycetota bacterium]
MNHTRRGTGPIIGLLWSGLFIVSIQSSGIATAQTVPEGRGVPLLLPLVASGGRVIDLTHSFGDRTIYWPTEDGFELQQESAGVTEKGYYYSSNRFTTAEHGGTHLDAPIHFCKDGQTVEQIPLDRLIGEAAVVDVTELCSKQPDYLISVENLREWEERHGRQLVDVILLLKTGYGKHWPDRERYLGTKAMGPEAVKLLHFPGLDPIAAQWLVDHRAIKAVGIDTASIDRGQSRLFGSHVCLCGHNVPIFENVANLDQLPSSGSTIVALPMKIAGGS